MLGWRQIGGRCAHGAAIAVTGWSLIATSTAGHCRPAQDCYGLIAGPTKLSVAVGPARAVADAAPVGCAGLDGLAAGSTVVFDVSPGSDNACGGGCLVHPTLSVSGFADVTLDSSAGGGFMDVGRFTSATGTFASSTLQGCRGAWSVELAPQTSPGEEAPTSVLDAGPGTWVLTRQIVVAQAQLCGGAFPQAGQVICEDAYDVEGITETP